MHPDLYLVVYHHAERELERRLERRRSALARGGDAPRAGRKGRERHRRHAHHA
ncbi:hypothetical protein Q9R32_09120 [Actinotalea sp. AC32]|nr:hypothetical protein [Actinotalea sp. AC32]